MNKFPDIVLALFIEVIPKFRVHRKAVIALVLALFTTTTQLAFACESFGDMKRNVETDWEFILWTESYSVIDGIVTGVCEFYAPGCAQAVLEDRLDDLMSKVGRDFVMQALRNPGAITRSGPWEIEVGQSFWSECWRVFGEEVTVNRHIRFYVRSRHIGYTDANLSVPQITTHMSDGAATLSWEIPLGTERMFLNVSTSPDVDEFGLLKNINVVNADVTGRSDYTLNFGPGTYYWNVVADGRDQRVVSELGIFGAISPPSNLFPRDGAFVTSPPLLAWEPGSANEAIYLNVSTEPDMNPINVINARVDGSPFLLGEVGKFRQLAGQTLYWQLVADSAFGARIATPIQRFVVGPESLDNYDSASPDWMASPEISTEVDGRSAELRWSIPSLAERVFLNISSSSSVDDNGIPVAIDIVNAEVTGEFGRRLNLEPGIYYWVIVADGRGGDESPTSESFVSNRMGIFV